MGCYRLRCHGLRYYNTATQPLMSTSMEKLVNIFNGSICSIDYTNLSPRTLSEQRCTVKSIKTNFEISWVLNISGDILSMSCPHILSMISTNRHWCTVFILPWLVIPELTLRRRLRYSLYATFLLGLINIIFCVVRFAQIEQYGGDLVITISLVGKYFQMKTLPLVEERN